MESRDRTVLLLGSYTNQKTENLKEYFVLSENAKLFDLNLKCAIKASLIRDGPFSEENKIKILMFNDPVTYQYVKKFDGIAVVNLGPSKVPTGLEHIEIRIENIIEAVVYAVRYLTAHHFDTIFIDSCDIPKIVGTAVAFFLCTLNAEKQHISIKYFDEFRFGGELEYEKGLALGEGQIFAQKLMKSSSATEFIKMAKDILSKFDVDIINRPDLWICEKGMQCLLGVSRHCTERPVILEVIYNNNKENKPLILVGKATPYESSLFPLKDKPELNRLQYKKGMAGASCIIGSIYTLCKVQAKVRVHCIVAVVWNKLLMSNKKGDVLRAMNGTSIQIDCPEAEGRLIMADLLCYAATFDSCGIMDITTLSSNTDAILGNAYVAFFTSEEILKQALLKASTSSGEKVWQLPLYKCFRSLLKSTEEGVIYNVGKGGKSAMACKSAAFLREFVNDTRLWIHLDISAVSECRGKRNYIDDHATGRSTRLVAEFCLEYISNI